MPFTIFLYTGFFKTVPKSLEEALCVTESGATPRETFVFIRGNAHARGERVEPGYPEVLGVPDPLFVNLAVPFWQGYCPFPEQLWRSRRCTNTPQASGLARRRIHGWRVADETHAPPDHVVIDVPDVFNNLNGNNRPAKRPLRKI